MDFAWTDEQLELRDHVIAFASRELDRPRPDGSDFSPESWKKLAELGVQGLPVPPEYGGSGADVLTTIVVLEALGYACSDNGLLFSLNAHMWACEHPIVRFGTEEQKQRYLPAMSSGTLVAAHGMSEPGSGSDAFALRTTAERVGGGYRLSGSKTFVTNAPVADLFVVFATTDRSKGWGGLCAFLLERDLPGLEVGPPLGKSGLQSSPMAELFFDGCVVPETAMLGRPGRGLAIFNAAMERERSLILATAVGSMERVLEQSVDHARGREQFGQPIGKFQAVAHRLVDMKLRLETARLLLYRVGWMLDQGRSVGLDAALTKLHLSESFVSSSLDAVRIHGGYGYMTELEVERQLRDAVGSLLYSGTSEIQKNLAAHHMGL
jgi:alkylation response protein AidB-like acyl-CoA dehydrogenase